LASERHVRQVAGSYGAEKHTELPCAAAAVAVAVAAATSRAAKRIL
jgi:hypothetical protein